jgi:hypothetical protein
VVLVLARWLAVRATRWSIRDVPSSETTLLALMFPRGLITAVLALQVVAAKGQSFFFVPAMAFTVVLFTIFLWRWQPCALSRLWLVSQLLKEGVSR